MVEPHAFTTDTLCHLRNSLRPVIPDNARILRMTAAAGTELAEAYSSATVIFVTDKSSFTTRGRHAFILHAALLHQAFAHCGKFPTAASRRSLGRSQSQSG